VPWCPNKPFSPPGSCPSQHGAKLRWAGREPEIKAASGETGALAAGRSPCVPSGLLAGPSGTTVLLGQLEPARGGWFRAQHKWSLLFCRQSPAPLPSSWELCSWLAVAIWWKALPALRRVKYSLTLFLASFEAWGLLPPTEKLPAASLFAWYLCSPRGWCTVAVPAYTSSYLVGEAGHLDVVLQGAWFGKSSQQSWLLLWCLPQTLSTTGKQRWRAPSSQEERGQRGEGLCGEEEEGLQGRAWSTHLAESPGSREKQSSN